MISPFNRNVFLPLCFWRRISVRASGNGSASRDSSARSGGQFAATGKRRVLLDGLLSSRAKRQGEAQCL